MLELGFIVFLGVALILISLGSIPRCLQRKLSAGQQLLLWGLIPRSLLRGDSFKLPRRLMLRILKYDLILDLLVSGLVLLVHWGSLTGVMAATVAGLLMSIFTSAAKRLFGWIENDTYYVGRIRLEIE